jgi:hypothetical protein
MLAYNRPSLVDWNIDLTVPVLELSLYDLPKISRCESSRVEMNIVSTCESLVYDKVRDSFE